MSDRKQRPPERHVAKDGKGATRARASRMNLLDVVGLVLGYGLAAVLFRAFWPRSGVTTGVAFFAVGFYLWLGLAMSGPLVLLRRRTSVRGPSPLSSDAKVEWAQHRTWAELAWLLIGVYWIVLGVFVLPTRMQNFRFGDTVLFGLVPAVAAVLLGVFGPNRGRADEPLSWTHPAAIGLLVGWPLAWFCLIVLGHTLL